MVDMSGHGYFHGCPGHCEAWGLYGVADQHLMLVGAVLGFDEAMLLVSCGLFELT
jgi:hypothetical protein